MTRLLRTTAVAATLPLLPAVVNAWGTLGHETVAFIAQNFVSADTATWAQGILDSTSSSYLASVATWADSYRYTTEGTFSAGYHYIDANDNPPDSCGVELERDCPDSGCIVSAIANYVSGTNLLLLSAFSSVPSWWGSSQVLVKIDWAF